MTQEFKEKRVLVTGAASGIGRATAQAFADKGALVIVSDVNEAGGEETVNRILQEEGQAQFIKTNVAEIGQVKTLVETIVAQYDGLDIAVNNAGIGGRGGKMGDYSFEDWHQVMDINLNGVFYCMKYELQQMMAQEAGSIVNISSIAGLRGYATGCAYSASKHGVIGLTKTAALEYARFGIRVNAVCPVFTRTPLFEQLFEARPDFEEQLLRNIPMRRYGQPEDIARMIVWLCSADAGFVTGLAVPADGGLTAR